MTKNIFPEFVRSCIQKALPDETAVYNDLPDLRYTFIPKGHEKALHHDTMLVEGIRGAGKGFWWTVLQKKEYRRLINYLAPKSGITEDTRVSVGFGEKSDIENYPGKDVLRKLLTEFEPRQIWRSIVFKQILKAYKPDHSFCKFKWPEIVRAVNEDPEEVERNIDEADKYQTEKKQYHLILFDALDRTADDWASMGKLIRGLLQVVLEFRSYRYIRLKTFLRPDHIDGVRMDFPDSSKILNEKVKLYWNRAELYGLLWQYLGNETENGELFRNECRKIIPEQWTPYESIWILPVRLRFEEETQKQIFHRITGPWMGKDQRRGFPYTWLPNHLGDSMGQVSPRSFLAALRVAAEDRKRQEFEYPIYYESIKKGVQEASKIRVREMQEDYPWVENLMKPLAGLNAPIAFNDINIKWKEYKTLEKLKDEVTGSEVKLPPKNLNDGTEGVISDLIALGVFSLMSDKRYNMPDVYRVGYGLGRKGGIKSLARQSED